MESAVCWSKPLLHPDTAGLDSTPSAEGKLMDGWNTASFFNPDIQSELQTGIPLRPQRLPTSPQFLSSHQLLSTRKPSRPWCQTQCSSYSDPVAQKATCHSKVFSVAPEVQSWQPDSFIFRLLPWLLGWKRRSPCFLTKNKRKGPLFWTQLEIWAKAKVMTGRSIRRRCLHPVCGIESAWGASPVAVSLSVCHGFCHCWRYTRDEALQPHFSPQNIIFFPWTAHIFLASFSSFLCHPVQVFSSNLCLCFLCVLINLKLYDFFMIPCLFPWLLKCLFPIRWPLITCVYWKGIACLTLNRITAIPFRLVKNTTLTIFSRQIFNLLFYLSECGWRTAGKVALIFSICSLVLLGVRPQVCLFKHFIFWMGPRWHCRRNI